MGTLEAPNKDARRIEIEKAATPAEVVAAIEALKPTELLRLRSYARFRMRALRQAVLGRNEEDLMSEAITATLAGTRRWNKEAVDMVGHLCGIMRSLSSHWAAHAAASDEVAWLGPPGSEPGAATTGAGRDSSTAQPDAERELVARQEVARIRAHFRQDHSVTEVLNAFEIGMKGPEIKSALGLSQREYETVLKRLRRGVERMERRGEGHE